MKHFTLVFIAFLAILTVQLHAQYQGAQQPGFAGLKAGSMPAPGLYITLPMYFRDSDINIYGPQSQQLFSNSNLNVDLIVLPAVEYVTKFKIFGATYGAAFTQWINNGVLNLAFTNVEMASGWGYGDIYVSPVILGWHTQHADITTGYSFFAPTGSGSHGLHMWVNEINFGVTLYPDKTKHWNLSTMMYYDIHRKKRDQDIKVGDILFLHGGFGRSFLKGAGNIGVAYSAGWKLARDSGTDIPPALSLSNGRNFVVGPEIDVPVFAKGRNLGLVGFRYQWPIDPRTAFGGNILVASFTFARITPVGR